MVEIVEEVVCGDVHTKSKKVKDVFENEIFPQHPNIQRIIFTGDIADDWGIHPDRMKKSLELFDNWYHELTGRGINVEVLFGNHDLAYALDILGPGTNELLFDYCKDFQKSVNMKMATTLGIYLVTHAGLTTKWVKYNDLESEFEGMDNVQLSEALNQLFSEKPLIFDQCGYARGGKQCPGPLWADRSELVYGNYNDGHLDQIVGHTPMKTVEGEMTPGGSLLWFVDTLSTTNFGNPIGDGSMLIATKGDTGTSVERLTGLKYE